MQFIKEEKTPKKENKNFYKKTRQKKSYKKTRQTKIVQEIFHANKNSCKKTGTKTRTRFFFSNFFFSWPLFCTSACFLARVLFLRGRFLAYEFLFPCFRVCFMHESFFAWMLSCTIYFFACFRYF